MKLTSQLKLAGLVPAIIIFGGSSYLVYNNAMDLVRTNEIKYNLDITKELSIVNKELAKERGLSALYLNTSGKIASDSLSTQREETDKAIVSLKSKLKNIQNDKNIFLDVISKIDVAINGDNKNQTIINDSVVVENLSRIEETRKDVDDLSATFNELFSGFYSMAIENNFKEIDKFNKIDMDAKLRKYISEYVSVLNTSESISLERDYLSKPINDLKPLGKEELTKWVGFWVNAEKTPDILEYLSPAYIGEIKNVLDNENNQALLSEVLSTKFELMEEAFKGVYPIEAPLWYTISSEKLVVVEELEKIISKYTDKYIVDYENNENINLMYLLGLWFFTIFLAVFGGRASKISEDNLLKLEKLFKEVISISDQSFDVNIDLNSQKGINKAYRMIEQSIKTAREDSETAKEASLTKSLFLANMSHEIRTPLNGIIGFTNLLRNTELDEEQEEFVGIIEKSSSNLLEIISNILDLSKIESNKIDIEYIEFDPVKEFESAVEIYAAKAAEKNIDLTLYMDPEIPTSIKGDPTKIQQVLVNLMSNAIKFTPDNGNINVEITKVGSSGSGNDKKVRLYFAVEDSGEGIAENKKDKIFESFSQADTSITRKFGGTGLGLTISREFIQLMGGNLDVESEVGVGSKFYFNVTLDDTSVEQSEYKGLFNGIKVGILDNPDMNKKVKDYYLNYFNFLGVKVTEYNINDKGWMTTANMSDNELIFIDFDYVKNCVPGCVSDLKKKIVFYAKTNYQQTLYQLDMENISKIIYEPVNFSKIVRTLEEYQEEKDGKKVVKKVTKSNTVDKFKANALVAEDNPINQKLIKRTLEDLGCTVTLAEDGLRTFDIYKNSEKGEFDIIFMDIQMPVMNGVESNVAIKEFDQDNNRESIPVIALTANALKGDREKFMSMGLDEYSTKPLVVAEIIQLLHTFLKDKVMTPEELKDFEAQKQGQKPAKKVVSKAAATEVVEEENLDPKFAPLNIALIREKQLAGKIIKKFLKNAGFDENKINIIQGSSNTVEEISKEKYDYIFIDENLKDTNGIEVINGIKSSENNKDTVFFGFKGKEENSEDFNSLVSDSVKSNANKKELLSLFDKYVK